MFTIKNENGLERFIKMQEKEYDLALQEIKNGKKRSCWMWYIFPQIRGLGMSYISIKFGIINIEEAIQYLQDKTLRGNLIKITKALLDLGDVDITDVFGPIDEIKLKSSMTLFNEAEHLSKIDCGKIFEQVLKKFFNGDKDEKTLYILKVQKKEKNDNKDNNNQDNNNKDISNKDNNNQDNNNKDISNKENNNQDNNNQDNNNKENNNQDNNNQDNNNQDNNNQDNNNKENNSQDINNHDNTS